MQSRVVESLGTKKKEKKKRRPLWRAKLSQLLLKIPSPVQKKNGGFQYTQL